MERSLCLALRITAKPRTIRREVSSKYYWALAESAGPRLLDVVEAVLAYKAEHGVDDPESVRRLIRLLDDAGSASLHERPLVKHLGRPYSEAAAGIKLILVAAARERSALIF
ncbi:hypothetical protein ACFVQ9_16850 [Streptomyces goshikiensis]|uniref:hypothetical protein n=1 Tax=Streptomyces goshikiensis TaxID=1942 RepID=UPI0036C70B1A